MFISLEGDKDVWMLRACLIAQSEVIHLDKERNLAPFAFFGQNLTEQFNS